MSCPRPLLLFFLLLLLVRTAAASDVSTLPEKWSVTRAVHFALENSPDSRIVKRRIQSAQAAIIAARAAYYPQVLLSGGYSRTNNPMYSFGNILNQSQFSQNIDFNNPGTSDDLNLTGTIQYRLYNGGRDKAGINAARAQEKAAHLEQDTIYRRLGFEVVRSFYSIVQAEDNVQAQQSSLQAIDVSLQSARARYDVGDLLKADLLNLEVQKSRAAESLIQARHGLSLAKQGFLNLLGLKQGQVKLDTTQPADQTIPEKITFEARPELARLDAMIIAAEELVRQAQGGHYPTADIFGSYQVDKGFEFDEGSGNSWMAGLKVNYLLFDGKRTSANVCQARARLRELKEQRRKLELAFNYEVEQARLALQLADEQLQVTEKMVEQAVESARLSRERFKEGVLLSTDLISVENRLTDARVHNLMAKAARKIAIADLRRAAGLVQFDK
ncbi:MAG: TolC family protein [Desulfobulbus sp.]|nr:MAG: TolC family protein [Desulfobulbus sp.]